MKKKILFLVGIFILLNVVYYFHHSSKNKAEMPSVIVEVAPVKQGKIAIQAQAIGTLTAEKSVQITPEMSGHIARILFQDGASVKKNQPLFQLDDKVYKAKLESAKANLFLSETNYKRLLWLGKKGAISQQAIDQALADLKEKKAEAEESQVTLDKTALSAPFDGRISQSQVSPGEYVSVGKVLASLADTEHLRVEYVVSEKYLSSLKLHQSVEITTSAYPGKIFKGHVSYISPTINSDNRTITLYATINNDDNQLTAGLFVNITQSLGMTQHSLLVPTSSLISTIDGQMVYKVVDGKAFSTQIEIGQRTSNEVEILNGLTEKDKVVIAGQQKLKEGITVGIAS